MKKRFPAIILALALCVGMAVPAFAADETNPYTYQVSVPNGGSAAKAEAEYQLLNVKASDKNTYTYESQAAGRTLTTRTLPLGATITVDGMQNVDNLLVENTAIRAWSDPDGDGVYEARLFQRKGSTVTVVPLTEKGPAASTSDTRYTDYITHQQAGFMALHANGSSVSFVTFNTNRLNELFGPNTLISVSVYSNGQLDEEKACDWFLLTGQYSDVPAAYDKAVLWAVANGITNGTTDATFSPTQSCTHAQILTFLYRAAGNPPASAKAPVTVADAYKKAVNWAYEKKLIDDSFDPNAYCTRSQAMMYIWQALGSHKAESTIGSFTDLSADAAYATAVSWAIANGLTNGTTTTTFSPDQVCNRGQIVTFLHRAYVEEARIPTAG